MTKKGNADEAHGLAQNTGDLKSPETQAHCPGGDTGEIDQWKRDRGEDKHCHHTPAPDVVLDMTTQRSFSHLDQFGAASAGNIAGRFAKPGCQTTHEPDDKRI